MRGNSAAPPARRARACHIPAEVFRLLAERLQDSTGSLLRLSMVCTAARDAVLRDGGDLWFRICVSHQQAFFCSGLPTCVGPAVVRSVPMRPYPNFKPVEGSLRHTCPAPILWQIKRARWPALPGQLQPEPFTPAEKEALAAHALRTARMYLCDRCGFCGDKTRNVQVWGLGRRVCAACLKDNLVSGAALYHEYGVDFNRHAAQLAGRVFYFRELLRRDHLASLLTHNPVDLRQESAQSLVFFWRPHLERVLDLPALRRAHRDPARREAASRLTGAVRALRVRLFLAQRAKYVRGCDHSFHLRAPAAPARPGAPYTARPLTDAERAAVATHLPHCWSRRPLLPSEGHARRLLQESFIGFRGRCTLPLAKFVASTLEKLRFIETVRDEQLICARPPSVGSSTKEFKSWFDLAPAFAGDPHAVACTLSRPE
jgi:hypothetical protein